MISSDMVGFIIVFLISLLPTVEVRGSIPMVFILFRDSLSIAFGLAVAIVGNLVIAPIVLTALKWIDSFIVGSRAIPTLLRDLYMKIIRYGHSKASKVNRYSIIGLAVFVAIPLPGTGAWTGSLVAYILGIDRRRALVAIELGVIGASLIVSLASILGIELVKRIFML
ncbi:MAG: small multi-drug export protein [Ignisphaera sp.]|uniref:Ligand-binding protein SH3 n=1 Tax=Ignisphaera aggregans TaxID=334771 RepID=A0A7J3JPY6_9CREN